MSSTTDREPDRVFPALLKYWRSRRGITQLDLSHTAEVSARHISFLETGRSGPSQEMVLLLADVLDVPLRSRNELLRSAGFAALHPESSTEEVLSGPVGVAIESMLAQHAPLPMIVLDRSYDLVSANGAAIGLLADCPLGSLGETNMMRLIFDAELGPASIANWDDVARAALRRLQREVMHAPNDARLRTLLDEILTADHLPEAWRTPDLTASSEPVLTNQMRLNDGTVLSFLSTMTAFAAPNNVAVEELVIETWFASDDATAAECERRWGTAND